MIVIGIIVLILLALIYTGLPLWAKFIVLALNALIPDPIPAIDEIFMIAATIKDVLRLHKAIKLTEWIRSHKVISILIVVGIIVIVVIVATL